MGSMADRNPEFRIVPPDGSDPWPDAPYIPKPPLWTLRKAGETRTPEQIAAAQAAADQAMAADRASFDAAQAALTGPARPLWRQRRSRR